MHPLIDADLLLYEVGFGSQGSIDGKVVPLAWKNAQENVDRRIALICEEVEATSPPALFLTANTFMNSLLNKHREEQVEFKENFRKAAAVSKRYKSNRLAEKPFHFNNLIVYLLSAYDCYVEERGLEADDAMCIEHTKHPDNTIICSRDKDLRQCPGWYYSWEFAGNPSVGPMLIDPLGFLTLEENRKNKDGKKLPSKLFGVGAKWLYAQILMGDATDCIGGIPNLGPVGAYHLLKNVTTERETYEVTAKAYQKIFKENWKVRFRETADLIWLIKKTDEKGEPVKWKVPKK